MSLSEGHISRSDNVIFWKVHYLQLRNKKEIISPEFDFANEKWSFHFEYEDETYINLVLAREKCESIFTVKLGMNEQETDCRLDIFDENAVLPFTLPSPSQMRSPSYQLTFYCVICAGRLLEKPGLEKLLGDFAELLSSEKFSDVLLRVEGRDFRCHRAVLGSRTPVFAAMFEHSNTTESQTGIVKIDDCDPDTFKDFLLYLYAGRLELTSDKALHLYKTADKYRVMELKEECLQYMMDNPTVENFCETLTLSLLHDEKELTQVATNFFVSNAINIVVTVKWQAFLDANTVTGNELFIKTLQGNKH